MNSPEASRECGPDSVSVDPEAQQRELKDAGWEPVTRMGKLVWRHPQSESFYPQGRAIARLRQDRKRGQ